MPSVYNAIDPEHYKHVAIHSECGEWIEAFDISEGFMSNIGQALQYILRHGKKPGVDAVEDLRKAIVFLNREAERLVLSSAREELAKEEDSLQGPAALRHIE